MILAIIKFGDSFLDSPTYISTRETGYRVKL